MQNARRAASVLAFAENISYRLSVLSFLVGKAIAEAYRAEQITGQQWKVLSVLCHFAPLRASEIESLVTLDKSAISRAVRTLQQLELIERRLAGSDARSVEIVPTAKGKKLHRRVAVKIARMQEEWLSDISEDDVRIVFRTFGHLEARLRKTSADGGRMPVRGTPRGVA